MSEPAPITGHLAIIWSTGDITRTAMPAALASTVIESIALGRPFRWSFAGQFGAINPAHVCDATFMADDPPKP